LNGRLQNPSHCPATLGAEPGVEPLYKLAGIAPLGPQFFKVFRVHSRCELKIGVPQHFIASWQDQVGTGSFHIHSPPTEFIKIPFLTPPRLDKLLRNLENRFIRGSREGWVNRFAPRGEKKGRFTGPEHFLGSTTVLAALTTSHKIAPFFSWLRLKYAGGQHTIP
jgi:hypothetical protein